MKKSLYMMGILGALALGGLASPALADGEEEASSGFSGTISLTSDYRFRGISQTDNGAAVQASLDYNDASGLFAGVWASNIDFNDSPIDASIEVDLYAGWNVALTDQTGFSIKGVYYWYPDADYGPGDSEYDYFELIAGLSRDFSGSATGTLEVAWSPDYFGEIGDAYAVTGGLSVPLFKELWFFDGGLEGSGHLGYQSFDDPGAEDYVYWDLGLTASVGGFALDVRYVDTDIKEAVCGPDICEGTVVATGTFSFGN